MPKTLDKFCKGCIFDFYLTPKTDTMNLLTKEQTCKLFGCTIDQLNKHYSDNAAQLRKMQDKAYNEKINGYTANQLKDMADNFDTLKG